MTMAATQQRYQIQRKAEYDLMLHPHPASSHETAEAAHIPQDHIAKAGDHEQLVYLRDKDFQALLSGARRGYYSHDS